MRRLLLFLPLLPLLLSACATSAPDTDVARIDRFVQRAMKEFPEVPSLGLAVVRDGKTILTRGYGYRDVERQLPATEDTVYYIASSTKSYLGLLTSILATRSVVDLDAPVRRYLTEVKFDPSVKADKVTLRTLLTHTSGIENGGMVMRTAFTGEQDSKQLAAILSRSKAVEPVFNYDNLGYVVVGLVLERVTGKPWQELLATELFAPLGMTHTTAYISRAAGWPLAKPYDVGDDLRVQPISFVKIDNTMHAAGGLVTTPRDLAKWLELNVNGHRAVDAKALAEAHEAHVKQLDTNWYRFKRQGYGFGWYHSDYEGTLLMHHFGGYEGWRTHVSFMPAQRHGVAALVNTGGPGAPVRDLIAAYIYDVLLDKPGIDEAYTAHLAKMRASENQKLEAIRADVAARAQRSPTLLRPQPAYAGAYANDDFGTLRIRTEGRTLRATLGQLDGALEPYTEPETARVELVPGQGEVLRFQFEGERVTGVKWRDHLFVRVE
ncbi:MAG TPA: serine hydrolase domain-containing protein [Thermoanaerobaculia bacterium]|jgi:CubicO group peptidase (beta-lactamase class C family)